MTVTNSTTSNQMISLTISGTSLGTETTTVSNAISKGDAITFAITATPANAISLRSSLRVRRRL